MKAESLKQRLHDLVLNGALAGTHSLRTQGTGQNRDTRGQSTGILLSTDHVACCQRCRDEDFAAGPNPRRRIDTTGLIFLRASDFLNRNKEEILRNRLFGMAFAGTKQYSFGKFRMTGFLLRRHGANAIQFALWRTTHIQLRKATFAEEREFNTGSRTFGRVERSYRCWVLLSLRCISGEKGIRTLANRRWSNACYVSAGSLLRRRRKNYANIAVSRLALRSLTSMALAYVKRRDRPRFFVPDYSGMDSGWFLFNLFPL